MNEREKLWQEYVKLYPIDVPEERVQNEIEYFTAQARHCMRYDTLTGGAPHPFAEWEIAQRKDEIRAAAELEAKSDLVIKDLLEKYPVTVTQEELRREAEALCERENTPLELVCRFFGDDFSGLERDVKIRKIMDHVLNK